MRVPAHAGAMLSSLAAPGAASAHASEEGTRPQSRCESRARVGRLPPGDWTAARARVEARLPWPVGSDWTQQVEGVGTSAETVHGLARACGGVVLGGGTGDRALLRWWWWWRRPDPVSEWVFGSHPSPRPRD